LQPQTLAPPEFEPRYFCAFHLDRPSNGRGGPLPRALSCAVFTATHAVAFPMTFPVCSIRHFALRFGPHT
jgi:hypothetical protein